MSVYGDNEDVSETVDRAPHKRLLNFWWLLLSFSVGISFVFLVGRFESGGVAEIAGIMAGCLVLNLRAFWNYHVKSWFLPLTAAWVLANLALLIFVLIPMHVHESRDLVNVIWLEFFSFAGLLLFATRLWGDPPD